MHSGAEKNITRESLKLAWNRHSHKFLATQYRKKILHPFYNPQFELTRNLILDIIVKKNPGINFTLEKKILNNILEPYWKHLEWIHIHCPTLHDWCGNLYRVAGAIRSTRLKNKAAKKISLLDAGCGSGNYYESLKIAGLHHFLNYTGVDIAEKNIENCEWFYPEAKFYLGDISELDFPDNSFDVTLVSQVFEHLPPKMIEPALINSYRVAKETLIINFFCEKNIPEHTIIPKEGLYYWNCLSRKEITKILKVPAQQITIIDESFGKRWRDRLFRGKYPVSYWKWIKKKQHEAQKSI